MDKCLLIINILHNIKLETEQEYILFQIETEKKHLHKYKEAEKMFI